MKHFLITWIDGSMSICIASNLEDAKCFFDQVGDVSGATSIIQIKATGLVVDFNVHTLENTVYTDYIVDEVYKEEFNKMYKEYENKGE